MHSDQAFSVGYTAGDCPGLRTGSYTGRRAAAGQCRGEWPAAGLARPRLFQDADHSLSGQRRIHVDGQSFLQHLIENIEAAESSSAIQGVTYEVYDPYRIGLGTTRDCRVGQAAVSLSDEVN